MGIGRRYHRRMTRPEPPEHLSRREPPERTTSRHETAERPAPELAPSSRISFAVITSLVVAVAALGLAAWPLVRSVFTSSDSFPDAEVEDATATVCTAHDLAFSAVSLQTNLMPPPDASGPLAAAANARLALVVASEDLVAAVDDAPAAPAQLQSAARELAAQYRIVASNYLAGMDNNAPPVAAALQRAGDAATRINTACGK